MTAWFPSASGVIVGYDPGGQDAHGLAKLIVVEGKAESLQTATVATTEQAIDFVEEVQDVVAIGIDTLTCWGTGPGGWRPADRWLRMYRTRFPGHQRVA